LRAFGNTQVLPVNSNWGAKEYKTGRFAETTEYRGEFLQQVKNQMR